MSRLTQALKQVVTLRPAWETYVNDYVQSLAWSPDGRHLAVAAVSGEMVVLDSDGRTTASLDGHAHGTHSLDWHPDGLRIASGGQDGNVRIWLVEAAESISIPTPTAWAERVQWNPVGTMLAAASGRSLLLISAGGEIMGTVGGHSSTVQDLGWSPDGTGIATTSYGALSLFPVSSGGDASLGEPRRFEWKGSSLVLSWSPDSKFVATGDQDSTVHFWYVDSGRDLQMYGYPTKVRELAWDRTSRYLATGGGQQIVVWDCTPPGPEDSKPRMLRGHDHFVAAMAFQHSGALLASVGLDGRLLVWNHVKSQRPRGEFRFPAAASQVAWSPDDRKIAVGTSDGTVAVFAWS